LVEQQEGFVDHFYLDVAGVKTIGYGSACNTIDCSTITAPISQPEAADMMVQELRVKTTCIDDAVSDNVQLTSNEYSALASFAYNIGCGGFQSSTTLKDINANNMPAACAAMAMWNVAAGVVQPGLVSRRQAEMALFSSTAPSSCIFSATTNTVASAVMAHPNVGSGGNGGVPSYTNTTMTPQQFKTIAHSWVGSGFNNQWAVQPSSSPDLAPGNNAGVSRRPKKPVKRVNNRPGHASSVDSIDDDDHSRRQGSHQNSEHVQVNVDVQF